MEYIKTNTVTLIQVNITSSITNNREQCQKTTQKATFEVCIGPNKVRRKASSVSHAFSLQAITIT